MNKITTGLERAIESPPKVFYKNRFGLLCNPASIDSKFNHASTLFSQRFPDQLKALYTPQHGFYAQKQDNMIESYDSVDPILNIPVFSLYGKTRIPTKEMLDPIDILIIDLQDVGTRVYTFIYTMSYCLETAKQFGKKVVILDRPNPIGGLEIEGNCLTSSMASFVGRYEIPMRHGLTIGELALLFNNKYGINCDLEIIPMKGWRRSMYFSDTHLPWVSPSPNLPTPLSSLVYPGQVLWEGTNISEGRGTTQPFELFGAPFIEPQEILSYLGQNHLSDIIPEIIPGVILRPTAFEPKFNKWQDALCKGFQIHITNRDEYRPYVTTLRLIQAIIYLYGDHFKFKEPPYEYEFNRLPIDLIIGDKRVRKKLEDLNKIEEMEESWRYHIDAFSKMSSKFHLYN